MKKWYLYGIAKVLFCKILTCEMMAAAEWPELATNKNILHQRAKVSHRLYINSKYTFVTDIWRILALIKILR